jgi:hypothetical protein
LRNSIILLACVLGCYLHKRFFGQTEAVRPVGTFQAKVPLSPLLVFFTNNNLCWLALWLRKLAGFNVGENTNIGEKKDYEIKNIA